MSESTRILMIIDNVHMGLGHLGLSLIAKKMKIDAGQLGPGSTILFLNRAKDKLKMLGANGQVIGYLKMPQGRKIMLESLQFIPQAFSRDGSIHYEKALTLALEKVLSRKGRDNTVAGSIYKH